MKLAQKFVIIKCKKDIFFDFFYHYVGLSGHPSCVVVTVLVVFFY